MPTAFTMHAATAAADAALALPSVRRHLRNLRAPVLLLLRLASGADLKSDQLVFVVKSSRLPTPAPLFPLVSSAGPHTQRHPRPGRMVRIPPPTPLFPGRPTR